MLAKGTTGGGDDANTFAAPTSAVAGQLAGVSGGGGGITGGTVAVQTNNANPPTPAAGSVSMQVPILQPYLVMRYLIATQGLFPDSQ
jgi:microcystin-dependent protein